MMKGRVDVITVFFDRESLENYKARQALQGVRSAMAKRKYDCVIHHELSEVPTADKDGRPIIAFSHSESRSRRILRELAEKHYRPVSIVNDISGAEYAVSCVSIDYRQACYRVTCRILEREPLPVAFLGFNRDSIPDKQRLEGFEIAVREYGAEGRVFSNFGDVDACLSEYWAHRDAFKNVVCGNDILAVALVNRLREAGEDCSQYRICGFGNTMLSRYCVPRITTVEPNYELAGRLAVEVCSVLERNPGVRAVTFTVDAEICEGETLGGETKRIAVPSLQPLPMEKDFYADETVRELDGLDAMLSLCDETDLALLRGLLEGKTHDRICEQLFISSSTFKYRIRKLQTAAGLESRTQLIEIIRRYRLELP